MPAPYFACSCPAIVGLGIVTLDLTGQPFQAGDYGILAVESCAEVIATPAGYTQFPNSPQSIGVAATADSNALAVFYRQLVGNETTTVLADSGDHTFGRIFVYRGVRPAGNPYDAGLSPFGDTAAASAAVSIPGGTTTEKNVLLLLMATNGFDFGSSQFNNDFVNASLQNVTPRDTRGFNQGFGGGFLLIEGQKPQPGLFSATTGTMLGPSQQTHFVVPLVGTVGGAVAVDAESFADLVTIT